MNCPHCGQPMPEPQPTEPEWLVWEWKPSEITYRRLAQAPGAPSELPHEAQVVHRFRARDWDAAYAIFLSWVPNQHSSGAKT